MYKVLVNEQLNKAVNLEDLNWDILPVEDGAFHIIKNNRTYKAKVLDVDYQSKALSIAINGNEYAVVVKDTFDMLVDKLGFSTAASKKMNQIKAPMPGLVLDVIVKVGDQVQKGDSVLILEAMKMENVIKADGEAVVKSISIEKGTAVEKNQVLVEFE